MRYSRSKSKSQWADHFTLRAKKQQYPARSVYKLQEIQKKFSLIKKGNAVLDLGCSPGSWLKYTADLTGAKGTVVGIDLKPIEIHLPKQVRTIQGDILGADAALLKDLNLSFDVILSDMAPSTTGMKGVDAARSMELCEAALSISKELLKSGGHFVCKIFQGEDFQLFANKVRQCFSSQKIFKPQSSRKNSKEIYIIGISKKW
jgi:23S rRNA (uridine2552-2'-O)-methyltransferase